LNTPLAEDPRKLALHRVGILDAQHEHRRVARDLKRREADRGLLAVDPPAQHEAEDVAGEAALGLRDDALAHLGERHDHHRVVGQKALEVRDAVALGHRDQPRGGGAV